jgi:hypothetical protein
MLELFSATAAEKKTKWLAILNFFFESEAVLNLDDECSEFTELRDRVKKFLAKLEPRRDVRFSLSSGAKATATTRFYETFLGTPSWKNKESFDQRFRGTIAFEDVKRFAKRVLTEARSSPELAQLLTECFFRSCQLQHVLLYEGTAVEIELSEALRGREIVSVCCNSAPSIAVEISESRTGVRVTSDKREDKHAPFKVELRVSGVSDEGEVYLNLTGIASFGSVLQQAPAQTPPAAAPTSLPTLPTSALPAIESKSNDLIYSLKLLDQSAWLSGLPARKKPARLARSDAHVKRQKTDENE